MKRIHRDPEKFEVINLFEGVARQHDLKLNDGESRTTFLDRVSQSLGGSQSNPILIHGRRIESMFEYVAASLGKCVLIKREDAGDVSSTTSDIVPPDFRLVLDDDSECFVEVKNYHHADPARPYKIKTSYLASLEGYARIFGRALFIAVYWSRWRKWALLRPADFSKNGAFASTSLLDAMPHNQMHLLGDTLVATTPPLVFRFVADPTKPRELRDDGHVLFTIARAELYCNGHLIEEPFEQQLAFYFMLHSDWPDSEPTAELADGMPTHIDYVFQPSEPVLDQGFQMLGYLSDMISRHYNDLTTSEGKVSRLSPSADPGELGVLIPPTYKGKRLPLWRFTVSPK